MIFYLFFERRFFHCAFGNGNGAARVEAASTGRMERAGYIPFQNGAVRLRVGSGMGMADINAFV